MQIDSLIVLVTNSDTNDNTWYPFSLPSGGFSPSGTASTEHPSTGVGVFIANTATHQIWFANFTPGIPTSSSPNLVLWAGASSNGGFQDGASASARFHTPAGLAAFGGFVFVADTLNNRVCK